MAELAFKEKFIGFIDILGFKPMIEAAENGTGRSLTEIQELLNDLGNVKAKARFEQYGPTTCPQCPRLQKNLDFEVTQVSDCAIVSAEISPAGAINLVHSLWGSAITLLTKGVMVRGYITRGKIAHSGDKFYGTGYHEAYSREAGVTAFKREADEKGTPFVEVDSSVTAYVADHGDKCVKEMFDRFVKRDGDTTALFPFKVIATSWAIGYGLPKLNLENELAKNVEMRKLLEGLKADVLKYVDAKNKSAMDKAHHYIAALNYQIVLSYKSDETLKGLFRPFPAHQMKRFQFPER